jgi:erythronate-4-phosphate dehydrogenase
VKILCASSVTLGAEAFATLGDIVTLPEQEITPEAVRDCDALITRSKVRVGKPLLAGSRVAFVGTATAGTDHLDLAYLAGRDIAWASAPGCNANSVAEYVVAALLALARRGQSPLAGRTIGLVGVGHVGKRVAELARALGLVPLLNDPPLLAETQDARYRPLDEILPRCDIVSLHVPLSETGPYATRGLAGRAFFERLKPGAWFINASRGEVAPSEALLDARRRGVVARMALDVFEREPACVPGVVQAADLATPHIAGYSYEGKLNGTRMVYRAACNFFEVEPSWKEPSPAAPRRLALAGRDPGELAVLGQAVRAAYDIEEEDRRLRAVDSADAAAFARHFERLRATYPDRHEFLRTTVTLDKTVARCAGTLRALGFAVEEAG